MKNLYVSFYDDNTFNALITPYYIKGNWEFLASDSLKLSFKEKGNREDITAFFNIKDNQMVVILNKTSGDELFGIDTLKLKKNTGRLAYRNIEFNKWRLPDGDIVGKLQNHIDYLIQFFQKVVDENKKSIKPDYSILATPFRFYKNGIGVQEKNSESMEYWEKTFRSKEDFETAFKMLTEAFPKCKLNSFKGSKYELYIDFLTQLKEKI